MKQPENPVDFAAVSIYKEGSDVAAKNYMSDIEGNFLFTDLPFRVYKIKISFIGYKTRLIDGIFINSDQPSNNLADIKLSASENNTLQEVVVTETKPVIEFGADTITFNVSQSIQAEGSTASDLLKSVPISGRYRRQTNNCWKGKHKDIHRRQAIGLYLRNNDRFVKYLSVRCNFKNRSNY